MTFYPGHKQNSGENNPRYTCPKCGESKPIATGFSLASNRMGHKSWCRICTTNSNKVWKREHKITYRKQQRKASVARYRRDPKANLDYQRRRKYGLSKAGFVRLLIKQGCKCAICGNPFKVTPHVDHSHKTNKIRGLLCFKCNTGIGMLGDEAERVEKALLYLRGSL